MTRKDFQIIADAIKSFDHSAYSNEEHANIVFVAKFEMASKMANALKAANPGFNRDKFMEACGL